MNNIYMMVNNSFHHQITIAGCRKMHAFFPIVLPSPVTRYAYEHLIKYMMMSPINPDYFLKVVFKPVSEQFHLAVDLLFQ